jgi:hypothetical protein
LTVEKSGCANGEPSLYRGNQRYTNTPILGDDCDRNVDYRLNFYRRIALRCSWTKQSTSTIQRPPWGGRIYRSGARR